MVRPRLVEEGKPLINETEISNWEEQDPDNYGITNADSRGSRSSVSGHGPPGNEPQHHHHHHYRIDDAISTTNSLEAPQHAPSSSSSTIQPAVPSSLSQAAHGLRGIDPNPSRKHSTAPKLSYRVEIGPSHPPTSSFDHDDDEDIMTIDSGIGHLDHHHHYHQHNNNHVGSRATEHFPHHASPHHGIPQQQQQPQPHHHPHHFQISNPSTSSFPSHPTHYVIDGMAQHQHLMNNMMVAPASLQQVTHENQTYSVMNAMPQPSHLINMQHGLQHQHQHTHVAAPAPPSYNNPSVDRHSVPAATAAAVPPPRSHHFEIGAPAPTERMEGVELGAMGPLVVIDGANVAYAYADALGAGYDDSYRNHRSRRLEPNVVGIQVACQYFWQHAATSSVRVLVVLPASYVNAKPRDGKSTNALMETDQWELLQQLKQDGKLVLAPPTDDDDAYVLTIALREWTRQQQQQQQSKEHPLLLGAYCLSNDLFRDALERNPRVREWLQANNHTTTVGSGGRISFAFVDMGQVDDHGQRILDIVPNPRHELILWMEQQSQEQQQQQHYGPVSYTSGV
ncbi:hypothetical protein ACA910_006221 [Epithemia clementina (nom. ined.)]